MSKIVILSFSEGEEEVCQRILQIVSESTRFEGCNELQGEKNISIGEMKLNLLERNVIIHGVEVMLTNREFEILYLLAQSSGRIFSKEQIYDIVWQEPYSGDYNIVMSHQIAAYFLSCTPKRYSQDTWKNSARATTS